jgi:cephalosporin hydroxylase
MSLKSRIKKLIRPTPVRAEVQPVDSVKNQSSSQFEVDGWVISQFVVEKIVPIAGVHPFPLQELMLMVASVCRLRPPMIFEWGTHIGKSARIFHETAAHFGIPLQIHSVDLHDEVAHVEHPGDRRGALVLGIDGVTLHQGDGLTNSLKIWEEGGMPAHPLFFVDGDHSYESVRREIDGILEVIPGSSLLLHDTFFQSQDSGYNIGPHQAIEETLEKIPNTFQVLHSGLSLPGMTLLAQLPR